MSKINKSQFKKRHKPTKGIRKKISESLKKYYKEGGKVNRGMLGKHHTLEWKEKAKERMLKSNPFKGKKHSKDSIEKMKENHIGMLDKKHTEKTKLKMSKKHKGQKRPWAGRYTHKPLSKEHKKHISEGNKGHIVLDITKEKIRKKLLGHPGIKGKDNNFWQGGISKQPYSFDFTRELKELIRKRDNYTCQICEKKQTENMIPFPVHHIDYNKKNSDSINLVTLCRTCHPRTNHNRDYWIKYFGMKTK